MDKLVWLLPLLAGGITAVALNWGRIIGKQTHDEVLDKLADARLGPEFWRNVR